MSDADDAYYGDSREEMLAFLPAEATRVLDVGCGTGGFGRTIAADRGESIELWGIETHAPAAEVASRFYQRVLTSPFPDCIEEGDIGRFDCVVFNDVLEHLADPWGALRCAGRILTEGGSVVASVPNIRCYLTLRMLVLQGDWRYEDDGIMDRTHLRFFTKRSLVSTFEDSGYSVDAIGPVRQLAASSRVSRALRLAGGLGRSLHEELVTTRYGLRATLRSDHGSGS